MKKIGIIGGGFSGTMTAINIILNASKPLELIIINEKETLNKGIAYNPYSKAQLLNVPTAKMSAFANEPNHFLDWIMQQTEYSKNDREIVASSFLPRYYFGQYLSALWEQTIHSEKAKQIKIITIDSCVTDLKINTDTIQLFLANGNNIEINDCVIASGNNEPRNPAIKNPSFYSSKDYFRNPWNINSVSNNNAKLPILIIGNGLSMVDTVTGLLENGFENGIYSISPNGFNILPHRYSGIKYTKLIEELKDDASLFDIVKLFNKHLKLIRKFGLSAEPLIDSMRPYTQKIWQRLSSEEKSLFMGRLRHLWGVARHRIPLHIYERIQQLRIDKKLNIYAGNIIDIHQEGNEIKVEFYNKKSRKNEILIVSKVINCTGPETDLSRLDDHYLKICLMNGIVVQDDLKLGINADVSTFQVIQRSGIPHKNLFTLGSNLKGMLWESTAVNELRSQAETLAKNLV